VPWTGSRKDRQNGDRVTAVLLINIIKCSNTPRNTFEGEVLHRCTKKVLFALSVGCRRHSSRMGDA